jgi:hypothetical protein
MYQESEEAKKLIRLAQSIVLERNFVQKFQNHQARVQRSAILLKEKFS